MVASGPVRSSKHWAARTIPKKPIKLKHMARGGCADL
jgi:hypothetical protein